MSVTEIVFNVVGCIAVIAAAVYVATRPHVVAMFDAWADEKRANTERQRIRNEAENQIAEAWADGYAEGREDERYIAAKKESTS